MVYDATAIHRACKRAWRKHVEFFPTLGQIVELVEVEQKSIQVASAPVSHQLKDEGFTDRDEALSKIEKIVAGLAGCVDARNDEVDE